MTVSLSIKMLMMFLRMIRKMMMNTIAKTMKKSRKLTSCKRIKKDVESIRMDRTKIAMRTQITEMSPKRSQNNRRSLTTQSVTTKMMMILRMTLRRWNNVDKTDYKPVQTMTMTWMMLMTQMKTKMLS